MRDRKALGTLTSETARQIATRRSPTSYRDSPAARANKSRAQTLRQQRERAHRQTK